MSIEKRIKGKLGTPGPFLAEVTNHLDPTYMGGLEVVLRKGIFNSIDDQNQTYPVKYLSPFYGVTSVRFEGNNPGDFNDVQKSYGMWMIPPDVGSTVMVIFIDGDPNQGYWFGCIQDEFQNHMVPGVAASRHVMMTEPQRTKYGTDYLPVAEFLKAPYKLSCPDVDRVPKPVHPFADRLLAQGLLLDTVRGVTSSSARREAPSTVFGISTPGPLDKSDGARKGKVGYDGGKITPVSRLGGSTFVMDDGDINGQNELVRIRTRTGHQILMHNSQDLIYIANSKGTAWIELTSNGKIDIYAQDSVSIHSEADFNFRADRDINFEAGRNINIRAMKNMETNIAGYYYLTVDDNAKISIRNNKDEVVGQDSKLSVGQNINMTSGFNTRLTSSVSMDLSAARNMRQGAGGTFNVSANGSYIESANEIHMNGPTADTPNNAEIAEAPPCLPLYSLPNRKVEAGWANGNFYKSTSISSIMQRVPTHEPWDQHENINATQFQTSATDVTLQSRVSSGIAENPTINTQQPANTPEIAPGTCDPIYAKDINNPASQQGISELKNAASKIGLKTPYAIASLLGIAGGESAWQIVTESFNYKSASRLLEVFPSVFKGNIALAQQYVGNPNNSLPEFLYGYQTTKGRGLGNTQPGDGAKFIGRGYIQLTGRSNYEKYSQLLYDKGLLATPTTLVDNPDLLKNPTIAAQVSAMYFLDRIKLSQSDPGYFEAAYRAVGTGTPDIYKKKRGYYECFLGKLSA